MFNNIDTVLLQILILTGNFYNQRVHFNVYPTGLKINNIN